jgi:uncharacterized membrane protein YeaQ/YmgE (transglycosylase-associated protein family)
MLIIYIILVGFVVGFLASEQRSYFHQPGIGGHL